MALGAAGVEVGAGWGLSHFRETGDNMSGQILSILETVQVLQELADMQAKQVEAFTKIWPIEIIFQQQEMAVWKAWIANALCRLIALVAAPIDIRIKTINERVE